MHYFNNLTYNFIKGTKLVRIALKLVEKWGDTKLFAAVDYDNSFALAFYKKLNFNIELDERDLLNRSSKKSARIFMSKTVNKIEQTT